jgi:E3 ubiquitin-protein ligase RNF38/44
MQELERAEAELERAAIVQQQQLQQQQQRGRSYNNYSRHLFSNSSGRSYASNSTAQYEGNPPSTVNRRRKRRGSAGGNNAAADPSSAAGAMFGGVPGVPPPPPLGPCSGRGGSLSGFSDPMAEFFLREAEAEAEWHRQQQLEGFPHEVEDEEERALDELMMEAAFRGRMTSRMSTGGPPSRRRGGGGGGRGPRERVGGRGGGHFSSILTELAALHQAVMGARSSALPSELLFSDRDFTEADYEALLALDEGVENRKGAKQDVINQLHSERVPRGHGGQAVAAAYGDCCICLEKIGAGQTIRKLECSHHFHKGCVDKWLKQKASCPICQRRIGIDIE